MDGEEKPDVPAEEFCAEKFCESFFHRDAPGDFGFVQCENCSNWLCLLCRSADLHRCVVVDQEATRDAAQRASASVSGGSPSFDDDDDDDYDDKLDVDGERSAHTFSQRVADHVGAGRGAARDQVDAQPDLSRLSRGEGVPLRLFECVATDVNLANLVLAGNVTQLKVC